MAWFYYFHGDFWHSKNVDMYSFGGGRRGSQKVYGLYTNENVDIYGRPLSSVGYFNLKTSRIICMNILSQNFLRKWKSAKQRFLTWINMFPSTNFMAHFEVFLHKIHAYFIGIIKTTLSFIICLMKQLLLCHTLLHFVVFWKLHIFIAKILHLETNFIMEIVLYTNVNMDFSI